MAFGINQNGKKTWLAWTAQVPRSFCIVSSYGHCLWGFLLHSKHVKDGKDFYNLWQLVTYHLHTFMPSIQASHLVTGTARWLTCCCSTIPSFPVQDVKMFFSSFSKRLLYRPFPRWSWTLINPQKNAPECYHSRGIKKSSPEIVSKLLHMIMPQEPSENLGAPGNCLPCSYTSVYL